MDGLRWSLFELMKDGSAGTDGVTWRMNEEGLGGKIVHKAATETLMSLIYEAEFLGFSYGFLPGRGMHDALDGLSVGVMRRKVNLAVDCDIRAVFETVSRDWTVRFLE